MLFRISFEVDSNVDETFSQSSSPKKTTDSWNQTTIWPFAVSLLNGVN